MARSKIDLEGFKANAHRGPKFLMEHFGVSRVAVLKFAKAHRIEVAGQVAVRKQAEAPLDVVQGVGDRIEDEIILRAVRLRCKGHTFSQMRRRLGVDDLEAKRIFGLTISVRRDDLKMSGEKPAQVLGAYW